MKKYRVWMTNDANPNGRMYYPGDEIEVGVGNHKKPHGMLLSQHGDLWSSPTDNKSESGITGNCLSLVRWSNNGAEVMFETGLKDKNDKDIYDGDIVLFANKYYLEVAFEEAKFVCYHLVEDWGKWGDLHRLRELEFKNFHHEVVGNLYENPELIQQAQTAPVR